MRSTRRAAVTASGVAMLGLAGCDAGGPASSGAPGSTSGPAATRTATPAADPDQVALDRAAAVTASLLGLLDAGPPELDPAGRLAAMHLAHLGFLQRATSSGATSASLPTRAKPTTVRRLRRRELEAQRELARLAQTAESGALARVLASMSAGIAAQLSHRGEVPA